MVKILLLVSLISIAALIISVRINLKQRKDEKILKNELKHLEGLLGAKDEIKKKKEQINTDDAIDNFNRSVQFLQNYSAKSNK